MAVNNTFHPKMSLHKLSVECFWLCCSYSNRSVRETEGLTFPRALVKWSLLTQQLSPLFPANMSSFRQRMEASRRRADRSAPLERIWVNIGVERRVG